MHSDEAYSAVINKILSGGADFAEIFLEERYTGSINMVQGEVEGSVSGKLFGAGLRAFKGTRSIYAYTNDLSLNGLMRVAERLKAVIDQKRNVDTVIDFRKQDYVDLCPVLFAPEKVSKKEKVAVMKLAHEGASTFSNTISQVVVNYIEYDQSVRIYNSEGVKAQDRRARTRLAISAVATHNGNMETGFYGPGGAMGFEFFNLKDPRAAGERAARIADRMVKAEYAPAGKMPVIISNEFGGVIFHEACGHALEATGVAKGASVFAGKLGQKIANECVSAVDDPTIHNAWGSANVDDEGTPTRRNLLIDRGILKSYMIDRLGALKMEMEPTGSARRQDYTYAPTSRMSNTFLLPGEYYPEEIIAATDYGLYAKSLGGGSVMPSTGEFNFAVMEGYMIENGRITKPVRGATLIGKGNEVLTKIDMVGNDLARGQGMCGSISGSIPADVGQPTVRVSELIVGGRN
ncbi:TldD/PmbA family protein [Mesotoga sp.]|jgi:TldD protein|uniref:Peptidase C69 n=1 Tax=Mesotoga infera TaxID=1236046 RepID=A0A117LU26_9BACT|nr:MAG: Peptidase U62 modulator of DNA gyrase [Mesotoga infera]KUK88999.1 MAG: Peptidase U62 modulator of DNA gyrase [Mesotoga infera]HCO70526.1 peptidase C69 [Mesotoga infera]